MTNATLTRLHPGVWAVLDEAGRRAGTVSGAPSLGWAWSDRHGCHDVHASVRPGRRHSTRDAAVDELLEHANLHRSQLRGALVTYVVVDEAWTIPAAAIDELAHTLTGGR